MMIEAAATEQGEIAAEGAADRALVVAVRFPEGLFHGVPDWPPAPFRLFCALVAGAYGGRWVAEPRAEKDEAFRWLERLAAPIIAAPRASTEAGYTTYVPNNDLDAVDGDPARIGEIRGSKKSFAARRFDADTPLLYVWPLADGGALADKLVALVERLHTFGRGIDMAYASAEVVSRADAEAHLNAYAGQIWRPNGSARTKDLAAPGRGSFNSLAARHAAGLARFERRELRRTTQVVFRQPPMPRSRLVRYSTAHNVLIYEFRTYDGSLFPFRPRTAVSVARAVRDRLADRLAALIPEGRAEIARVVKGDGADNADKARRIQFLPLPTIGHPHADFGVRRIVLIVPSACPISLRAIRWALDGIDLSVIDDESGEFRREGPIIVATADDTLFARHYVGAGTRLWQSVVPVALPRSRGRRRSGAEEAAEQENAVIALRHALRHAGIDDAGISIRFQQAPHHRHGHAARDFADERFGAERLAHVELTFPQPVTGPIAIGDGRFLGLGLFAPAAARAAHGLSARVAWAPSIQAFAITAGAKRVGADGSEIVAAFRRAVMARMDDELPARTSTMPVFFSGHNADGTPSRADPHDHLYFALDPGSPPRLLAIAPHRVDRRQTDLHHADRALLDSALAGLKRLTAGRAGALDLVALPEPGDGDPLIGPAMTWISATPYRPTRHPKRGDDLAAIAAADAAARCRASGLPDPRVDVLELDRKAGLRARLRLTFPVAVAGPILLGRDAHFGGGLFRREEP